MQSRRQECVRFGLAVRNLRTARGLSQEQFADAVAVHRTYIGGIERGERNPTLMTMAKIAKALGVSVSKLLQTVDRDA